MPVAEGTASCRSLRCCFVSNGAIKVPGEGPDTRRGLTLTHIDALQPSGLRNQH